MRGSKGWEAHLHLHQCCGHILLSLGAHWCFLDKWLGKQMQALEKLVVRETIANGLLLLEDWRRLRRVWQLAFHLLMEKERGSG